MTHLATLAQIEWDQRIAFGRAAVAQGRWKPIEAEARLMPWLAVALLAGAEPEEARAELEIARRDPAFVRYARAHVAEACCPGPDMRAELIRARDAAVAKVLAEPTNRAACERSTRLQYLAVFLGVPNRASNDPQPMQEAA